VGRKILGVVIIGGIALVFVAVALRIPTVKGWVDPQALA
jgi:hypothetical protein